MPSIILLAVCYCSERVSLVLRFNHLDVSPVKSQRSGVGCLQRKEVEVEECVYTRSMALPPLRLEFSNAYKWLTLIRNGRNLSFHNRSKIPGLFGRTSITPAVYTENLDSIALIGFDLEVD